MNYLLTLLIVGAISLTALKNVRWAVAITVLSLALMPRYLVVPIGSTLFPSREIFLLAMGLFGLLWVMQNAQITRVMVEKAMVAKHFLWATVAFILFSALISVQSGNTSTWSIMSLGYEFLNTIGIFLLVLVVTQNNNAINSILLALVVGLFISELLALIEYPLKHILLKGLIDVNSISGTELFTDRSRGDVYRVRGMFDNHLMLAEYISISWPVAWVVYVNNKTAWMKGLALSSLILAPMAMLLTGARSGLLVIALGICLMCYLKIRPKLTTSVKFMITALVTIALVALLSKVVDIINSPEDYFLTNDSASASSIERALQYQISTELVMAKPLYGYGKGLKLDDEDFLLYIDSYILVVLLEGGLLGFIFFMLIWGVAIKHARTLILSFQLGKDELNIAIGLLISIFSLLLFQLFISIAWNNIYLYVFEGLIVSQLIKLHSMRQGKHDNIMTDGYLINDHRIHQK